MHRTLNHPIIPCKKRYRYAQEVVDALVGEVGSPHWLPGGDAVACDHEVRVPIHTTLGAIEPGQDEIHEGAIHRLVHGRDGREFSDPDGHVAQLGLGSSNVGLERRKLLLRRRSAPAVPMKVHEVVRAAAGTGLVECLEPWDAHERRGGVGVCDSGRSQLHTSGP